MTVGSGRALGSRYLLVDRLGEGAMGEVWRVHDHISGTYRAAKLLKGNFAGDHDIVARFVQERSILVTLDHPNIVKVHDMVVEGDDLAIVMDLIDGPDLRTRLRSTGTLGVRDAVTVTCAVLDALSAAHAMGCLHRDVKPDNVLLVSGDPLVTANVRLTDFSIARLAQESTVQSTGLLGTPGYMPPELFTDGRFSAASDLYATGILLYELLAGRTPFAGSGTAHTVGFRHVQIAPPSIPVPGELWQLVSTMLAKDPSLRLGVKATAAALRELSEDVLDFPALAVQTVPDNWDAAMQTSVSGSPIRQQVLDADLDVGATNMHSGASQARAALAETGQVQAFAPMADSLHGETQLGVVRTGPIAPVLVPEVTQAPERQKHWWPWAVGAVVLVGAILGGLVVAGVLGGGTTKKDPAAPAAIGPGSAGPVTVRVDGQDTTYDSGLGIRREATWDAETSSAEVSFTFEARTAPLQGGFLQVLPLPAGSRDCALPTFSPTSPPVESALRASIGVPCGYVFPGELAIGDSTEITATVALDLPADSAEEALSQWLGQVETLTDTTLQGISGSFDFAAQRLTGIDVQVNGPSTFRNGDRISYVVRPEWFNELSTEVLFNSPQGDGTSRVFDQVAGGPAGLDVDPDCDAVGVSPGFLLEAVRQGDCEIHVTLGAFEGYADVTVGNGDN